MNSVRLQANTSLTESINLTTSNHVSMTVVNNESHVPQVTAGKSIIMMTRQTVTAAVRIQLTSRTE